jgi:hypothetical protein
MLCQINVRTSLWIVAFRSTHGSLQKELVEISGDHGVILSTLWCARVLERMTQRFDRTMLLGFNVILKIAGADLIVNK